MENQDESIPLGWEIAVVDAELFDFINEILYQLHPSALVNIVDAHDGVSPDIKVSMVQILSHSFHQVFKNTFVLYFWHES